MTRPRAGLQLGSAEKAHPPQPPDPDSADRSPRKADLQQRSRDHYGGETVEEPERQGEYEAFDGHEEAEGEVEEERDARPGARVALVDHAALVTAESGANEALEEADKHARSEERRGGK